MADVDIQRKGPSMWPWIIGLLVLALLIWALVELFEDDDVVVTEPAAAVDDRAPAGATPGAAGAVAPRVDAFDAAAIPGGAAAGDAKRAA